MSRPVCRVPLRAAAAALSGLAVVGALLAGLPPAGARADEPSADAQAGEPSADAQAGEPSADAQADEPSADALEELRAAQERAEAKAARRAELDRAVIGAQAELAATAVELAELTAELERVRERLADAEQRAEDATAAAEAAGEELRVVTGRLAATRDALERHSTLLADQARHSYKYGSVGSTAVLAVVESLTTAESPADFSRSMVLLDTILGERVAVVDEHHQLVEELAALAAEARRLQARRAAEETAAEAARDRVSALVATQQQLVAEVTEREARQEALLAALEIDRDAVAVDTDAAQTAVAELTAAIAEGRRRALAGDVTAGAGVFRCPVDGPHSFINDWGFPRSGGRTHEGTDIFAPLGTPIVAMADGTVTRVTRADRGLGGLAVSYVTDGFRMYNAHLAEVADGIEPGVAVTAGEVIGTVGTTGNARGTSPHNHFGLYTPSGRAINPYPLLAAVCDR